MNMSQIAKRSAPKECPHATAVVRSLLDELNFVAHASVRRSPIPLLKDVALTFASGRIDLLATNLDLTLRATIAAESSGDGGVTVNANDFATALRSLPADEPASLVIDDDAGCLNIVNTCNDIATSIRLDARAIADFPTCPEVPALGGQTIDRGLFLGLLSRAKFSATDEETKFQLRGALLQIIGGEVQIVATDGHRISWAKGAASGLADFTAMVDKIAFDPIAALSGGELRFGATGDPSHVWFVSGDRSVLCRSLDVKFPNWREVIAADNDRIVTADRQKLLLALSRVAVTTSPRHRGVRLDVSINQLEITATNVEVGESSATLPCDYHGPKFFSAFNLQCIRQFLEAVDGDTVTLAMKDENSQLIARAPGDPVDFTYVVMPMRLA